MRLILAGQRALLALLLILQALAAQVAAQEGSPVSMEYDVKAAFIYKFGQYVTWPASAFENPDSPVVVGVAASEEIVDLVRRVTRSRTIQGRPIKVKAIVDGRPEKLHVLFVARSRQSQLPLLRAKVRNQPTLLITESATGLDAGGVVNFRTEQEHVRFDINRTAAERQGLRISAQLLSVARKVWGKS